MVEFEIEKEHEEEQRLQQQKAGDQRPEQRGALPSLRRPQVQMAVRQLDRQTESQRRSDLQLRVKELEDKGAAGLTEEERRELRQLLLAKGARLPEPPPKPA